MNYNPPGDAIPFKKVRLGDIIASVFTEDNVWVIGEVNELGERIKVGVENHFYILKNDTILLMHRPVVPVDQIPVGGKITDVGADGVHFEFAIKADSSHWWGFGKSTKTPPVLIPSIELDYWDYEA